MIIAQDRLATPALPPLGIDQYAGVNLEMPVRVVGDIPGCAAGADPAILAKQDAAYFLRRSDTGQLLQICQHRA